MRTIVMSVCLFIIVFVVACAPQPLPGQGTYAATETFDPAATIATHHFSSEADFKAFAKKYQNNQAVRGYGGVFMETLAMTDAVPKAIAMDQASEASAGNGAIDYSGTNNQVQNVDEADILKTDGSYIYTVTGSTVFIVKAYPGEDAEVVSTLTYDSSPQGLFIKGNFLAVFGYYNDLDFFKKVNFRPRQGMTFFNIYDVSDKENPKLVKEYKFEGSYFQSRMTDDWVYLVVMSSPEYREFPTPVLFDGLNRKNLPIESIAYFPIPYQNPELATIHAIKLDGSDALESESLAVEGSQAMYMSAENIYLTYTEYINQWEIEQKVTMDVMEKYLTDADKELIDKIKNTDDDVLSSWEKQSKIYSIITSYSAYLDEQEQEAVQEEIAKKTKAILDDYDYLEYTIINKVHVSDGSISVDANGKVPGHISNQFSMDEYDGIFRIATTLSERWQPWINGMTEQQRVQSSNNVYTLDSNLNVLDSITGIAEGEQIYSTRFMGEKLYMVTFRQVDPFFVIDLSNPKRIQLLGELKIPGFSRYLHPYDENTIIGIGRDTSETGRMQGLKISLFDVSDFSHPREIAKFVTEEKYAQSTAEYEHKAFLFSKEKNLLVIPAYSYAYARDATDAYNGAMVFTITKNDIEMRGIIDHSAGQPSYSAMVERSLYINDLLYTKSPGLLRINELDTLKSVKRVDLKTSGKYVIY
ncbi:MAG: beta-propeller domain-containing protein [archaeon]